MSDFECVALKGFDFDKARRAHSADGVRGEAMALYNVKEFVKGQQSIVRHCPAGSARGLRDVVSSAIVVEINVEVDIFIRAQIVKVNFGFFIARLQLTVVKRWAGRARTWRGISVFHMSMCSFNDVLITICVNGGGHGVEVDGHELWD